MASTLVAIALPAIMSDLGLGSEAIWWLVTGYLLLVAILQAPAGRLGDRLGHRRLLVSGTILMAAAAALASVAPDAGTLVGARLSQGVAGAAIVPPALAMIRLRGRTDARERSVGIFLAAMIGGALLGVVGGGLVVAAGGWRPAFAALAILAVVAAAAAGVGVARDSVPPHRQAATSRAGGGPRRLARPALGIALVSVTMYVVMIVLPMRLDAAGTGPSVSALLLGIFVLGGALGAIGAARAATRFGEGATVRLAGAVAAGAIALVAVLPVAWILPALAAAGVGVGVITSTFFAVGLGRGAEGEAGTTSGLLSTARYVGSIAGTAALPLLLGAGGTGAALLVAAGAAVAVAPLAGGER